MEWTNGWLAGTLFAILIAHTAWGQDDAAARIAERLKVPLATMPQLKEAPAMDAAPDFKGWAGPLAFQNLWGYGRKLPVETRGYVAIDGRNVYMAIRCDDPDAKEIASAPVPPDGDVWAGDCAEFMILPGYDPERSYYHFAVNPAGSLYDARGKDKSWDSGARVFATIDAAGWLAVVRVPLSVLGVKEGEAPAIWRVNLYHVRPARGGAAALDLAWSPTGSDQSHVPARFSVISLDNGQPPEAAALEAWMKSIPSDRNPATAPAPRYLDAEHGVVCRLPKSERFSYFGWGTVVRMDDGTLVECSSGFRSAHVCPFGKTVLNVSTDNGKTWSAPRVIQKSMIDNRDAGLTYLGGRKLLASWFRSDTRLYVSEDWLPEEERKSWSEVFATWDNVQVQELIGSWTMLSEDGGETWGAPVRAPVSAPHGPIRLRSGDLLYLGKPFGTWKDMESAPIVAVRSKDEGRTWQTLGRVPLYPRTVGGNYHEPHAVELPSGKIVGAIRLQNGGGVDPERDAGVKGGMSIMMTDSDDGGLTWSDPRPLNFHGGPPHLLRHSSGVLILSYGYRQKPYGQRVAFSRDDGKTWEHDWIIRDDGPDGDLGYPSTVELADGSLFTVCYQKAAAGEKCSLLWSRWKLPVAAAAAIPVGTQCQLFVDRFLIERLDRAVLKLHEPVPGGVAIRIDKPWEGPGNFGAAVIEVDGQLLMYYRAWALKDKADETGVICVAESRDGGNTWTKPVLNLVKKPEWPQNNIVATADGEPLPPVAAGSVWLDARPGVPPAERIKMLQSEPVSGEKHTALNDPGGPKRLVFLASADGFTFRKLDLQPGLVSDLKNAFDGGNTLFWSGAEQQYVLYYRWWEDDGGRGHRSMARTTSKDLRTWMPSVPMTYGDTPREHLYVNNTQPYFRAPHLYIAPAARFMEGRQAITEAQAAELDLKRTGPHVYFKDCSDGVLLTSRAGSTAYDRTFMDTFIRPGPGYGNWASRSNYPLTGILPAGPNQLQMFVTRHYMQDSWHIERLLLRADGFASVNAPWTGGEMLTRPLTFTGKALEINYRTGAPGFVRVEIQDAAGKAIPGFALDDCPEIIGDEISRIVSWKQGSDVSRLAGQPVRLRFVMKDADLFALRFR